MVGRTVAVDRASTGGSVVEVLDRVLDKGIVIDAWVRVALLPTSRSGPAALGHLDGASSLWRGRVDVPGLPVDHVGVGAAAGGRLIRGRALRDRGGWRDPES